MIRLSALAAAALLSFASAQAQSSDIVVFSEMGEKFTLVIDGDVKNETPATRVVAKGIRNETPLVIVRVAVTGAPPVKQNAFLEFGKEYTMKLTTNKKGEYVLRMQGMTDLGTTATAVEDAPKPTTFREDPPAPPAGSTMSTTTGATQSVSGGGEQVTTTVQTVESEGADGDGENVNMSFGINGMGINMNVGVTNGTGTTQNTTTTRTTTTTTTVRGEPAPAPTPAPVAEPPVYRMPGYTGPIGCAMPMSDGEFNDLKGSIASKSFEDSKMTMAKQVAKDRCFSAAQVKAMMGLFSFEESKLDFAKFAYDRTHDIGNYYKVNDAFSFESSIEELNEHIQSR
jgi:hypothetical protein